MHWNKGTWTTLVVALAALALPASAGAATITPDILTDEDTADASCSLREAVTAANTDGDYNGCVATGASVDEDADTIVLQPGMTYDLSVAGTDNANVSGDLDVTGESLTIESGGAARATIDGNGGTTGDRVLDIDGANAFTVGSVTLSKLVLTDGNDSAGAGGGAVRQGFSTMLIEDSVIRANASPSGAGAAMRLDGSSATINDTVIHSNTGGSGGFFQESGSLTVSGSTVSGNTGTQVSTPGGALIKSSSSGATTLVNSTISGNSAPASGGGIFQAGGTINLRNSTVTGNTADSDAGGTAGDGGGVFVAAGTFNARNSILAGNIDASGTGNVHPDCSGALTGEGYDLIESTTGCVVSGDTTGNVTGADPMLDALDLSSGPTETHALLAGSPAINAANPADPDGAGTACEATDQRGEPRGGAAGTCDIGAFENQPPALDPIGAKSVQVGQTLAFTVSATHPDPFDTLTFSAANLPAGATFDPGTRAFSWTPGASQVGSFPGVTFSVGDGIFSDDEAIAIAVSAPSSGGGSTTPAPKAKKCKKKKKGKHAAAAKKKKCKKKKKKRK